MDQENHEVEPGTAHQFSPAPASAARKKRGKRKWVIISIILLLLLAGAAGGYWFVKLRGTPAATQANSAGSSADATPTPNTLISEKPGDTTSAGTTLYTSTQQNLNLSFSYPSSWTVSPKQTTASATTPITATSPATTIPAADGGSVTGKVVLTIRPGGGQVSELVSATAAQDSVQMAYKAPTASQRQYPFLTFVHLAAGSKAAGAFEEVMITGGQQFKKADVISGDNLGSIDPLITAAFYRCATTECPVSGPPNLSITNATWQSVPLFTQTADSLASFKLN